MMNNLLDSTSKLSYPQKNTHKQRAWESNITDKIKDVLLTNSEENSNKQLDSSDQKESLKQFLSQLRDYCSNRGIPLISPETEALLCHTLQKTKPKHCLEIGSAVGYSSLVIANTIAEWGGELVSFEVSHPDFLEAQENIRKAHSSNIKLHHLDITKSENLDWVLPDKYDFAFIDAQKSQYGIYLEKIKWYLSPQNTILLDDVIKYQKKVQPLYELLKAKQIPYELIPTEKGDGVMLLKNI